MDNNKLLDCIKGINEDSDNVAMTAAVVAVLCEYFTEVEIGRRVYNTQNDRDARILLDKYGAANLYTFAKESNNGYVIAGDDLSPENVQSITPVNYSTAIKTYFPKIEERIYALYQHGHSLDFIQNLYGYLDIKKFFYDGKEYKVHKYVINTNHNSLEENEIYYFYTKKEAVEYANKEIKGKIGGLENYLLGVSSNELYELIDRNNKVKIALKITRI